MGMLWLSNIQKHCYLLGNCCGSLCIIQIHCFPASFEHRSCLVKFNRPIHELMHVITPENKAMSFSNALSVFTFCKKMRSCGTINAFENTYDIVAELPIFTHHRNRTLCILSGMNCVVWLFAMAQWLLYITRSASKYAMTVLNACQL